MHGRRLFSILAAVLTLAAATTPARAKSVEELEKFLARKRTYSEQDRRAVLAIIEADVPDAKGRFQATRKGQVKNEDLDWLDALKKVPAGTRALDEVIADVEAVRELAASQEFDAGRAILDFAFTDAGLIYRDECGRNLREMSPYSLPALIVASKIDLRASDKRRYARYQLERLDREHPLNALHYAPNDEVKVAILHAYKKVHHREAVLAVLEHVDDVSPAVRAAAREAWMAYVTGPMPKEAPKKKLQLPGGKLTEEEMPLWLNYRELASIFLRQRYEDVTGEKPPRNIKLSELSEQLFQFYDQRRELSYAERLESGLALAADGKPAEAAAIFDAILGAEPTFSKRAEMAPAYMALGALLKKEKKWSAAGVAFSKAYAVAPEAAAAQRALAEQFYSEGRVLQKNGGDPTEAFRKALEHDPSHKGATAALAGDDPDEAEAEVAAKPRWMFYTGLAGGAFALLLLIVALRRRHG